MDSPSSSWILFWMLGYLTRYMRLQDRAVVTVSKPGQKGGVSSAQHPPWTLADHQMGQTGVVQELGDNLDTQQGSGLCSPIINFAKIS